MVLPRPCFMLVTDRSLCALPAGSQGGAVTVWADRLIAAVEAAVTGGVDAVQLREKDLASQDLLPLARRLREVTRGQAALLVNGPLEIAADADADGVHLPDDAPPVGRPRRDFLVGRSVHSLEAARRAEAEGVDYLIAGPVYETRSHPGRAPAGVSLIREITRHVRTPTLAIGGVTAGRVEEVVRAGAAGIAVISAVLTRPDRRVAADELRRALDAAWAAAGAARL